MAELDEELAALAREACGDIPRRYCRVVGVEIEGNGAQVWLLTNEWPSFEEYQVSFSREGRGWVDGGGTGGFMTGTPEYLYQRAERIARGLDPGLAVW